MGPTLEIEVVRRGAELVLTGRLDARTAGMARATVHHVIDSGQGDVLLRLGGLEIWDGAGLGVLAGAERRARGCGRRVVLADVTARQMRLLRATRLHRLFVIEPLAVAC